MPKRGKSRGKRKRYGKGQLTTRGRAKSSRRSKSAGLFKKPGWQGKKVVRYSHPHQPGLFNRKVRGSKRVVLYSQPRIRGRKPRRVASDAVKTGVWRKLLKQDPAQLRFRKKGRKLGVYDTKGRLVSELPYRKEMAREVKARLRLAAGERKVRDIKKVRLSPGKDWRLLGLVPSHGDMTFWQRTVYSSRQGVPIGQPIGTPTRFWGRAGTATSGKELWKAFNRIQPLKWERIAAQVPDWFRERGGAVGVTMKVMDSEGRVHEVWTATQWPLSALTDPQRGQLFLSEMLATALSQAGRKYGYGGATLVLSVGLEIGVREPGAPMPVIYGKPIGPEEEGEEEEEEEEDEGEDYDDLEE